MCGSGEAAASYEVEFYGHVRQYRNIQREIDANMQEVLLSGNYVQGPMLKRGTTQCHYPAGSRGPGARHMLERLANPRPDAVIQLDRGVS